MFKNVQKAYQTAAATSYNRRQLVVVMFEGMERFMRQAIIGINKQDYFLVHRNLVKTQDILLELLQGLNFEKDQELSENLRKIYVFAYEQVVTANLLKDTEILKDILEIMKNIKEGWQTVEKRKISSSKIPSQFSVAG